MSRHSKRPIPGKRVAAQVLATGLLMAAVGATVDARETTNGAQLNGVQLNGVTNNRLAANRLTANRLSANRLSANKLATNKLSANRLSARQPARNDAPVDGAAAEPAPNPFAGLDRQAIAR